MKKNHNLWAPWRIDYLKSLDECTDSSRAAGCFLCDYRDAPPDQDRTNLLLWRTANCLVLLNRFPYTAGHLLIAPTAHAATMDAFDADTLLEMMLLARDAQTVLSRTIKPHGFNIGININRCAGAGLPDHIHLHLVPRWDGDTNFMDVTADIRVISQALTDLYDELCLTAQRLGWPDGPDHK